MKTIFFIYLLIFLIPFKPSAWAQDERYFKRKIFNKKTTDKKTAPKVSVLEVSSPTYKLDLNSDLFYESLKLKNRDGVDYLQVLNSQGKVIFSHELETKGFKSRLYKVQLRNLSSEYNIILLYYFEGVSNYLSVINEGRVYFLTYKPNSKLSHFSLFRGPSFFIEHKKVEDYYYQRKNKIELIDFNSDGVKEVRSLYHLNQEVYMFRPHKTSGASKAQWKLLN